VDVRAGNGMGQWKAEWLHYGLIPAITPLSRSISWSFPHGGARVFFETLSANLPCIEPS
jgi:hypothetical protein